jgi:hypothetical protein
MVDFGSECVNVSSVCQMISLKVIRYGKDIAPREPACMRLKLEHSEGEYTHT